jgi:heptose I phosphotransferase
MKETFWQRLSRGVRRIQERPDWPLFAGPNWADGIMTAPVTDRFHAKQGRSTGRWIAQTESRRITVYLKRHYHLPWWRGFLALVWPNRGWSPALKEWRHLQWAQAQGLPVPSPVAAAEYIGPWGKLQSFLAVEELTDMLALHEAIPLAAEKLKPQFFRRWKRGLARELARLTRELHHHHFFHKDLYLCHFYIPISFVQQIPHWRGRVHMIDFHRLGRHFWTRRIWQLKDLGQLVYSSEIPGIDARDRLHFWRAYLGNRYRPWGRSWLQRLVMFKWRQYRNHNQK